MKIAYFTESLYPLVDGVSRTLSRLFATLEKQGVDFDVFSPFQPDDGTSWRGRVHPVGYVRFPLYRDYRISLPLLGTVRRVMDAEAPDLVHVVSPTPMAYAAQRLARSRGIPVVASFHTHFVSYFRYYGFSRLQPIGWSILRAFYRGCSRVYAPSHSIIEELEANGIENVELWSRGIDLVAFSPAHRRDGLIGDLTGECAPVLLLVSRLVREKDLGDLVETSRILTSRGVRFRLALVGEGPMRAELEAALPNAIFAGHRTGEELANWYASADVFVFPSTTETLGNVVLEALASGLPTVVVDRGGPKDLITHGENGFIAPANDTVALADLLQAILEDVGLRSRMSMAARASATSRDWETINGALLASYRMVIDEYRSAGGKDD
jgi:phosphatidylinositol alpha 1,6-mannosyltransferase